MGRFGIVLDEWAVGDETTIITITFQSICIIISLMLVILRVAHIYKHFEETKSYIWSLGILQFTQLLMMIFSCLYMFFHLWNYLHLYIPTNIVHCFTWWVLLGTSFPLTRIFLIAFLMLRSSSAFHGTFCELSYKISITTIIICVIGNFIPCIFFIVDATPISPFVGKGFCWRILTNVGDDALWALHIFNCIISTAALVVFYWKARLVKKLVDALANDNKMNDSLTELDITFRKHTNLGMITVAGTVIVFFVSTTTSVLLGIIFAFDQTVNNILTFIMFKEYSSIYECLCCKRGQVISQQNVITLANLSNTKNTQQPQPSLATTNSCSSNSGNKIEVVLH